MISEAARRSFDQMLEQALRPAVAAQSSFNMESRTELQPAQDSRLVAITLSSYLFRMMVLIGFSNDEATRSHMARWSRKAVDVMTEQEFVDALFEMANMGCGALSRSLTGVFPHIGMSTPNLLDWRCAEYLQILRGSHRQQFAVTVDSAPLFHVYLCVSEYADLDFHVNAVATQEESTGELEMF